MPIRNINLLHRRWLTIVVAPAIAVGQLRGQQSPPMHDTLHRPAADSAYSGMQARGETTMGVDQYTSIHHFTPLPDGGQIRLERGVNNDSAGTARIRQHLHDIARAFATGDFSTPMFVHMQTVPGAATMAARRAVLTYTVSDLPRGGILRISTRDPEVLEAVHRFLAFQRSAHQASP